MAKKQLIKNTEARILVYLESASDSMCSIRTIGLKLNISKNYMYDLSYNMFFKGWVRRKKIDKSTYLILTPKGVTKLKEAKRLLAGE